MVASGFGADRGEEKGREGDINTNEPSYGRQTIELSTC